MAKTEDKTNLPAEAQQGGAGLPATLDDFAADADQGFQGVGSQDMAIPFLSIIQSNSPQRKKNDGAYIPGADEGMVFNTVSGELFKCPEEEIVLIPCAFKLQYLNWRDRDSGGGLLGIYDPTDEIVARAQRNGSKEMLDDGTYLSKTCQHYLLQVYPDNIFKRVVISMSSTQIKKSRRWLTIMGEKVMKTTAGKSFTPPMFAYKYLISTQPESNDKGDWHGWKIGESKQLDLNVERDIYEAAKKFSKAVLEGQVQVAPPPEASGGGDPDVEDIPF